MIIILRRKDVLSPYRMMDDDKLRLYHFDLNHDGKGADLVVFLEDNQVRVLSAAQWPYEKPMSAAELLRYIAEHAA